MTYQQTIDWLYSTQQFGIKLGLEQPRKLLRETLSFPAPGVKVIHVAGTNGKGSTCAIIDSLARACGRRTGLFTSPHLINYGERIRVSGEMIPKKTIAEYLTKIQQHVAKWENHPTFFEITLAVAMRYFREKKCELIILETGMGGRLDATTAVPADLAVITPIAMDHSQWLGETLDAIAAEKAGIIVSRKPVLSAAQEPEAHAVIEQTANENISPIEFMTEPLEGYSINIPGAHQRENAALAVAACHKVGISLNSDTVRQALAKVTWPGRFEKLADASIILDAAHNPHAAKSLVATWQEEYPNQKAQIVFGAVEGKNTDKVLAILSPIAEHLHLTPIESPRTLTKEELQKALPDNPPPHTLYDDLQTLIEQLQLNAPNAQRPATLICGSIFLIGQAKALLTSQATRPSSQ